MIRGGVSGRLVGRKIESPQNHKGKEKGNQCYTEGYIIYLFLFPSRQVITS